jgi:DNA mismatch repair ATPase MutS
LEALSALATFADLNKGHTTYPQFIPVTETPIFEVVEMGHPLIPASRRVCNSLTVENKGDIALLTGSNMSGKSTFLRTIGLNLSLTFAGAPVIAEEFRTLPFRQYACIRVTDSVTDGISYFYAEVRRLKGLLDELERDSDYPLLFLIDEIFRGTNNRERLVGSRSYIRSLVGTNGTGIIATHDLELVQLADEFEKIDNYHFRDEVRDGKMIFDYKLHEGPSPTTNALKIMQMEGLPVDH